MEWLMMFVMLIIVLLYMAHVNKSLVSMLSTSFHELAGEIRNLRTEITKLHYAVREVLDKDEDSVIFLRTYNQSGKQDLG